MSKYTKANYSKMTEELEAQLSQPIPVYIANVKSCLSCKHYDTEIAHCHKLSELTGCVEYTEWCMICKYYDGHEGKDAAENLYGWYEIVDEEEKEE